MVKKELLEWELFKLKKGEWLGMFPFGYTVNTPKKRSKYSVPGSVQLHPHESLIVQDIFDTYCNKSHGINSLYKYVIDKYGKIMSKSHLHRSLSNPFYKGIMVWKGYSFPHIYPTIVTDELFEKAQIILKSNNKYTLYNDVATTIKISRSNKDKEEEDIVSKIMNSCKNPISSEALIDIFNISISDMNAILLDLSLEDKIEEVGADLWKIK